ncbi:MAG: LysR substrate-binding domain-containing protein [Pseudomonadota bacterium]
MELRHLRSFIAVAEELHFQRAARRVNLSQPALSQQIKALEEEVGVLLLARDRRSVSVTSAGEAFLLRAREAVDAADRAVREARDVAGTEPTELRLGYVSYLNLRVITRAIAAFRSAHPHVDVRHEEMPTQEVYAALRESQIDLGIGVLPATHPTLKVRKIATGFWSVVVASDHPVRARLREHELPLEALRDEPLALFERSLNPALYDRWIERFRGAGFEPKIAFETNQVQTGLDMARDGEAAFLVASYIVDPPPPDLARLRLGGFDNSIELGAVWREDDRSSALNAFLRELRSAMSSAAERRRGRA